MKASFAALVASVAASAEAAVGLRGASFDRPAYHGREQNFPPNAIIPKAYPLYEQCDPRWADDVIVSETVCEVGCLMSSISMSLGANHIQIPTGSGQFVDSNPGSLNTWLKANGGYDTENDLSESTVPEINPAHVSWNDTTGMHVTNDISFANITSIIMSGQPVIANVMKGRHFVLAVGWNPADNDTIYVNDPGFSTISYSYSADVVGWRLFHMTEDVRM